MGEERQNNTNLRPLWDAILEVYKVFADICERHGLRYCADCGTALGAVRHGGFIPWDDDMDIQMPRPDYEKFVAIAQRELPSGYSWVDRNNFKGYDAAFGKIMVSDSSIVNRVAQETGMSLGQGIFIDVFPLDGYPETKLGAWIRRIQNNFIRFQGTSNLEWSGCRTLASKLSWIALRAIRPLIPQSYRVKNVRDRVDFYERRARKWPYGVSKMCVSVGLSTHGDDKPYPVAFFGEPKQIPFDSVTMNVQGNVDGYLKAIFGDYMVLPPEDKRVGNHGNGIFVPWRLGRVSMQTNV